MNKMNKMNKMNMTLNMTNKEDVMALSAVYYQH